MTARWGLSVLYAYTHDWHTLQNRQVTVLSNEAAGKDRYALGRCVLPALAMGFSNNPEDCNVLVERMFVSSACWELVSTPYLPYPLPDTMRIYMTMEKGLKNAPAYHFEAQTASWLRKVVRVYVTVWPLQGKNRGGSEAILPYNLHPGCTRQLEKVAANTTWMTVAVLGYMVLVLGGCLGVTLWSLYGSKGGRRGIGENEVAGCAGLCRWGDVLFGV